MATMYLKEGKVCLSTYSITLIGILLCLSLHAQEPLVIRILAEKTPQTAFQSNSAVSVVDAEQLESAAVENLNQLGRMVHSLQVYGEGSGGRSTYLFMRGIGATLNEPAVGFYVDGVPYLREGLFDLDLSSVEQVEILRGPQGSLYGRNALGGIINITTQPPQPFFTAKLSSGFASFNTKTFLAHFNIPIAIDYSLSQEVPYSEENTQQWLFNIAIKQRKSDGFTTNQLTANRTDKVDNRSLRGALNYHRGDFDMTIRLDSLESDNGAWNLNPLAIVKSNPHHVQLNTDGYSKKQDRGISMTLDTDLENIDMTSITAYRSWDSQVHADLDYSPLDIVQNYLDEEQNAFSQEIRIHSHITGKRSWLWGLFYSNEKFIKDLQLEYAQAAVENGLIPVLLSSYSRADFSNWNQAIFAQWQQFLGALDISLGLRYEYEQKTMRYTQAYYQNQNVLFSSSGKRRYSLTDSYWLPKISMGYQFNQDYRFYATWGSGYRSGGFNYTQTEPDKVKYQAEHALNYELGIKSEQNDLSWQLGIFYTRLDEQQLARWNDGFLQYIANVGEACSKGLEAELNWQYTRFWSLTAGYNYTDARYTDYQDPHQGVDYSGNQLPFVAKHNMHLAVEYQYFLNHNTRYTARVELQGMGDIYWNENNQLKQPFYKLFNAQLEWQTGNWRIAVWAKNLFDKTFQAGGLVDPRLGSRVFLGAPRTIGINLSGNF